MLVFLAWVGLVAPLWAQTLYPLPRQPPALAFPTQDWQVAAPIGLNAAAFDKEIADAFDGRLPILGETRALLIVQQGMIVYERNSDGYTPQTRHVSWSMAKSFTQALVGVAWREGRLNPDQPMGNARWPENDPKSAITWRQWLNFVDGLDYYEIGVSATRSDATRMLFGRSRLDVAHYAARLKQKHPPGTRWNYSTASSQLIADRLGDVIAPGAAPKDRRRIMRDWMRDTLFAPIGMRSAQPEFDAKGTFIGGSLIYATPRDFAKFGLLYLRDGVWDGRRILPEGWVDFARAPGPDNNSDVYGAGFWINPLTGDGKPMYGLIDTGNTRDAFSAQGHEGQIILMVPSKDLIIVRLGMMREGLDSWNELYRWMGRVAQSYPTLTQIHAERAAAQQSTRVRANR
jgi:CubicO group peptidase (beta-lactamase class C family)